MFARFPRHLVSGVAPAVVVFVAALGTFVACTPAEAAQVSQDMRITMSDGVSLQATLTGQAPLTARPVIVEFSPYGSGSATTYDGPA
ncbi:MAG: hypothetical protein ACRDNK_01825, partial [Solirubrobacteraceae bacterium]